jgi:hypothetical protein
LLGTGVARRPDPRRGLARVAGRTQVHQLGDAEVEQARLAVVAHQHVAGLEVAMDDEALVGVLHRCGNAVEKREPRAQREPVARDVLEQRHAVDVLHHDVRLAVVGLAAVEQMRDVGMVELRQDLALLAQAALPVLGRKAADQLDRDALLEAAVGAFGKQHRTHAAGAEFAQHAPGAEARAECGRAWRLGRSVRDHACKRIVRCFIGAQQSFERGARFGSECGQFGFTFGGGQLDQAREQRRQPLVLVRRRCCDHALSAVFSQARAKRRSRSMVLCDVSSACATSSRENPPK